MKLKNFFLVLLHVFSLNIFAQELTIEDLSALEDLQEQAERFENSVEREEEIQNELTPRDPVNEQSIDEIINYKIFGHRFLNNSPNISSSTLDIPLNNEYQISFKDELQLLLTGSLTKNLKLTVDLSGNVLIPDIGKISLAGLNLKDAQTKIETIISQKYVGVNSFLNIENAAYKKISIIGAVKEPGTYLVNPFSSIIDAIRYSGGLEKNASLRKVKVSSNDGTVQVYDLYDFLIKGISVGTSIKNGDTIIIGATSNHFEFTGNVNRPMIYEYTESDNFSMLIDFALGVTKRANLENITVSTAGPTGTTRIISPDEIDEKIGNLNIQSVNIGSVITQDSFSVQIKGNSTYSGYLNYRPGTPFSKLMSDIVFDKNIYPFYGTIEQFNTNLLKKEFISFSIADPTTYEQIDIQENVIINFFSRSDISILSQEFEIFTDLNEEERNKLLDESDQFVNSSERLKALYENIEKTARKEELQKIINPNDLKVMYISTEKYNLPIIGRISPMALFNFFGSNKTASTEKTVVSLKAESVSDSYSQVFDAKDLISVNIPSEVNNQIQVEISGLVAAPGIYTIANGTSLDTLYSISGGFLKNSSYDGVIVLRESVKERERTAIDSSKRIISDAAINSLSNPMRQSDTSINFSQLISLAENINFVGRVAGDFAPESIESELFVLEQGDRIIVPPLSTSVTITGEVLNPITTNITNDTTVKSLIEFAGGTTKYADLSKIYIIKANGQSLPYKDMLFSKEIFLNPGDTVVVPRDLGVMDTLPLVSVATKIISDIAFAAASLNTISD